ncbi:hypothetical protein RclHR1_05390001 [Rhizophagus clarus]|nr:hypothetical protein RclHR1_05390001 [Rhizophagus clarus]
MKIWKHIFFLILIHVTEPNQKKEKENFFSYDFKYLMNMLILCDILLIKFINNQNMLSYRLTIYY